MTLQANAYSDFIFWPQTFFPLLQSSQPHVGQEQAEFWLPAFVALTAQQLHFDT
jgi:hypothetical protein